MVGGGDRHKLAKLRVTFTTTSVNSSVELVLAVVFTLC